MNYGVKETNSEHSLEVLLMKLQYFGLLMSQLIRIKKQQQHIILGEIEGKWRKGQQEIKWLDNITNSVDTNLSKLWETVEGRGAWHTSL